MAYKDREARLRYAREYDKAHKEQRREYDKARRDHRYACQKANYGKHKERIQLRNAERFSRLTVSIKNFLGGKCSCCGISEFEFLTIDHVKNDGAQDRKSGKSYYKILKLMKSFTPRSEVEKTYQLLCMNCNLSKHFGGGKCIHERRPRMIKIEYVGRTK